MNESHGSYSNYKVSAQVHTRVAGQGYIQKARQSGS